MTEYKSVDTVHGRFYLDGEPVTIQIKGSKIEKIIREKKCPGDVFVAPGLIDQQVNGYMGVDFGESFTQSDVDKATQGLWKTGVTSYLPTLITGDRKRLLSNFNLLTKKSSKSRLSIPGYHLEGPYISPKDGFRGAHPLKWVQEPDWDDFLEYARASGKGILQVSLAPELPHAIEFIQNCTRHGIIVALAHHNASATTIQQAIDSGAKIATHLGNGCANTIHRHYNPLWPQLSDDRLWISMIADGFHLPPEMIQVFYKVKGANKIILTSDITRLAGLPAGEYKMMGSNVRLTKEGKIRLEAQDVLAGAALPLIKGVENMYKYTHCSLADAIHMATRNPASLNGLTDRGALLPGKRADIILFSFKEGVISIKETILAGKQVFKSNI